MYSVCIYICICILYIFDAKKNITKPWIPFQNNSQGNQPMERRPAMLEASALSPVASTKETLMTGHPKKNNSIYSMWHWYISIYLSIHPSFFLT